jgi:hypothetical protein
VLISLKEVERIAFTTVSGGGKKIRFIYCLGNGGCSNVVKVSRVPSRGLCQSCAARKRYADMEVSANYWSPAKYIRPYEPTYNTLVRRAKRRGIPVELTYEQFCVLYEIPDCHYCGINLNRKKLTYGGSRKRYTSGSVEYSLDRKDNLKGYSFENSVPCCPRCNFTKRNFLSYGEMVIISEIRKFNKSKEIFNANN